MTCEQCGNEFFQKITITLENGEKRYKCPYCRYFNENFYHQAKKRKKKK